MQVSLDVQANRQHYQHNVRLLSELLLKEKIKYDISTSDIAKLINCSNKCVATFLKGKTIPDHIFVMAIIRAIIQLKKRKL